MEPMVTLMWSVGFGGLPAPVFVLAVGVGVRYCGRSNPTRKVSEPARFIVYGRAGVRACRIRFPKRKYRRWMREVEGELPVFDHI